jgi:hypothetical protein
MRGTSGWFKTESELLSWPATAIVEPEEFHATNAGTGRQRRGKVNALSARIVPAETAASPDQRYPRSVSSQFQTNASDTDWRYRSRVASNCRKFAANGISPIRTRHRERRVLGVDVHSSTTFTSRTAGELVR